MEYSFHVYNKLASDGVAMSMQKLLFCQQQMKMTGVGMRLRSNPPDINDTFLPPPVVVCIGSDLAIGDSLGPITGSMLKFKTQGLEVFIYGTLASPITAKEISALRSFLKESHPNSPVIAIDAAVGTEGDVGLMKLSNRPLLPGTGANKQLGKIGDFSIMGIVAEKSVANYSLLNSTRLNLVYTMSEIISDGLASLLWECCANARKKRKRA